MYDLNTYSNAPVALELYANNEFVNVHEGDYITIQYDGGQTLKIYPPEIDYNGKFYIDITGNTYRDRELCNLAKSIPTPIGFKTPTPTLTPIGYKTPTPVLASPTPSPTSNYCAIPLRVSEFENEV